MSGQLDNCAVCGLSLNDHWLATCPENADCANPVTWDDEPVYSPATVAEGLFDGGAFEQMKGQTVIAQSEHTAGKLGEAGWTLAGEDYRGLIMECPAEAVEQPANGYIQARHGKWHQATVPEPCFTRDETSACGLTFRPLNVTWNGKQPPTSPAHLCKRCKP